MYFTQIVQDTASQNHLRYILNKHIVLLCKSPPSPLKTPKRIFSDNACPRDLVVKRPLPVSQIGVVRKWFD